MRSLSNIVSVFVFVFVFVFVLVFEPQTEEHAWEVSEKSIKPDNNRVSAEG